MSIDPDTGVISWTPASTGNFDVTVAAGNYVTDTQAFTVSVVQEPSITSTPVTSVRVNQSYSYDVDADAFPDPTYSLTTKPAGMTIDSNTGVISWAPTSTGNFNVTVRAQNAEGADTQSFTVQVAQLPSITTLPVTTAIVDEVYSYDVAADGFPAPTFSLTNKPAGMTINANTGVISWTPTSTGTVNVTVRAQNSEGSDSQSFTIDVDETYFIYLPTIIK